MSPPLAVAVFVSMLALAGWAQVGTADEPRAEVPWSSDSAMARPVEVRYIRITVDAVAQDAALPDDVLGAGSWRGPPPLEVIDDRNIKIGGAMAWLIHEGDTLVELVDGRTINNRSVAYTTLYAGPGGTSMSVPVAGHDLVVLQTGPDGGMFTGPFFGTNHRFQVPRGLPVTVTVDDTLEEVVWHDATHGERVSLPATYHVTFESLGDVVLDFPMRDYFHEHPEAVLEDMAAEERRGRLILYRL